MKGKGNHFTFASIAKQASNQQTLNNTPPENETLLDHNGLANGVFEDSFVNDHAKRQSRFVTITRMDTYTKLNKPSFHSEVDQTNKDDTSNESMGDPTQGFSRRGGISDRSGTLRIALKNRLRKIVEERLTIRQIFTRYVEGSTLHGFRYTCSDTYIIRRVIWAILMILGAVYFLVKLKEGIIEYFEYPFSTLFMVDFVDVLTFPAITFCPVNSYKYMNNTKLLKLYHQNRLPLNHNWSDPGFDIPGNELKSLLYNASVKFEDIFEDCDWIRRDTDHPLLDKNHCGVSDFTPVFSDTGQLCYTLNSGKNNHELYTVRHQGLNFGYELLFDLKVEELLHTFPYSGINIIIHPQSKPPIMSQGFTVSPGFKTFVAMSQVETKNLPPPYATKCGMEKLKYFPTYNQKACLLELLTDYTGEMCKCREPFMPDNGLPYCSLRETILCMLPAKESFNEYDMRKKCPIDCEVTSYKTVLSDSRYLHGPPVGVEKILLQRQAWMSGLNESHLMRLMDTLTPEEFDHYIETNLINVIFYYQEMKKDLLEQEATFDFYQFLGDMGGEIGLMLGASLLTFVEFVDLIIFVIYHQLLRLRKKGNDKNGGSAVQSSYESFECGLEQEDYGFKRKSLLAIKKAVLPG